MTRIFIYILVLILLVIPARAVNDGGTNSPFSFGAGARDISLGGANLTTSDVTTAPYWNASRLAAAEKLTLSGFHSRLYDSDVAYQYFGLAIPTLDWGSFGFGVFRLGIDGIERRDENNILLDTFDDNRLAFYFAYAKQFSGFDIGLSFMMERHSLDDYNASSSPGINVSIGRKIIINHKRFKEIAFAVNGRNILRPGIDLAGEKINDPYTFDFAVSIITQPVIKWNNNLTISARLTKIDFVDPRYSAGIEYSFSDLFHLRSGLRDAKFSLGGGITYKMITFDYALVNRDLGSLHLFSITSSFGKSINEKRKLRALVDESKFNSMMMSRLTSQSKEMIENLIITGKEYRINGILDKAEQNFDRALFLARNNGVDTTELSQLVGDMGERLTNVNKRILLRQYLDSAKVKLDSKDYLTTGYFANQALLIDPKSDAAKEYLNTSNLALDNIASTEEIILERLLAVDSLIGYGQIKQARTLMRSLLQYAPDEKRVQLANRKVEFEYWREKAFTAYNTSNYDIALPAIDSALTFFPGHKWCLQVRDQMNARIKEAFGKTEPTAVTSKEPISADLLREVESSYKTAQEYFEKGDLSQAVQHWEKVERLAPDYQSVREYLIKAYKFIGIELYGQNNLSDAIATWEKAVNLNPGNVEINDYIKRTRNEIRKLDELTYGN
ncbi:MAG: hypothetical protein GY865_18715 [candidate division Zixibacteria bacterium]|nr:hypothetical protein [candidate division Zixibacteria bacterium]